jgi:hypothetical protein
MDAGNVGSRAPAIHFFILKRCERYVEVGVGEGDGKSVAFVVNILCWIPGKQFVFARKIVNVVLVANVPIDAVSKTGLAANGVSEGVGSGVGVEPAVEPGIGTGVARNAIELVPAVETVAPPCTDVA